MRMKENGEEKRERDLKHTKRHTRLLKFSPSPKKGIFSRVLLKKNKNRKKAGAAVSERSKEN